MDVLSRWGVLGQMKMDGQLEPGWEHSVGLINDMFVMQGTPGATNTPNNKSSEPVLSSARSTPSSQLMDSFRDDNLRYNICQWLSLMTLPTGLSHDATERVKSAAREYFIEHDKLWRIRRRDDHAVLCVPRSEGLALMQCLHEELGHWSKDILTLEASKLYDWPGMSTDAVQAIKTCSRCQQFGPVFINFLLQPVFRVKPFDLIAMDYMHLPPGKGGFSKALVAVDYMTRWVWGFMIRGNPTSASSAKAVRSICEGYCPLKALLSDNASHFKGEEMRSVCEKFGISQ